MGVYLIQGHLNMGEFNNIVVEKFNFLAFSLRGCLRLWGIYVNGMQVMPNMTFKCKDKLVYDWDRL